jgi:glycosyltransferase involved in cell wall biosynthesis
MRITIVVPEANMSGGIRVVGVYAESLCQRGHKVLVVYPSRQPPSFRQKVKSVLKGKGLPRPSLSLPSHLDLGTYDRLELTPWRPVTDEDLPDADVVIATWWETAEWVEKLSARKGTKVYFIQGYEIFGDMPAERLKATWSLPMHKIVVSSWLRDIARVEFGDSNVSLVPNSVDTKQFFAVPRSKQRPPTVGMVYSGSGIKGSDISLRAYEQARDSVPDLRLIAFGGSPPSPNLPLPKGASFFLHPAPETLRQLYASCDGWLFGSRKEGFGLPILESMACRTPVIATPAGAAPELLAKGGGFLVAPEDPQDMCRAIVQLCRMSDVEWEALSARALSIASSYSWDDATDRFLSALTLATERSRRGDLG